MTPEEGSARTAGERHQERIVGSPRSPLASLRPLVAAGGSGRSGRPAAWGWTTLGPAAAWRGHYRELIKRPRRRPY